MFFHPQIGSFFRLIRRIISPGGKKNRDRYIIAVPIFHKLIRLNLFVYQSVFFLLVSFSITSTPSSMSASGDVWHPSYPSGSLWLVTDSVQLPDGVDVQSSLHHNSFSHVFSHRSLPSISFLERVLLTSTNIKSTILERSSLLKCENSMTALKRVQESWRKYGIKRSMSSIHLRQVSFNQIQRLK